MADGNAEIIIVNAPASFRSQVWKYFGFEKNDKTRTSSICKKCFIKVSYKTGNTSNMATHLKRIHGISSVNTGSSDTTVTTASSTLESSKNVDTGTVGTTGQLRLSEVFKVKYSHGSVKAQSITKAIGAFIAKDMRPYSIIENPGFRNMISVLDPRYTIPGKDTLW